MSKADITSDCMLSSSASRFEPGIGFSRAVRVGAFIAVAGECDAGLQTRRCCVFIGEAQRRAGASPGAVERTRIMPADIAMCRQAARAHGGVFGDVRPACTFIEASGFIDPLWLVEIEADAVVA